VPDLRPSLEHLRKHADLEDRAFDDERPTPLACATWALRDTRADDGDHLGTIEALVKAGAPTRSRPRTIDALLASR
jgi:hypothetical protein